MNKKNGLDYFPLDVDFFQDEKIQFVSARFGTKGESITVRLLCKIYRQGYYIDWNEDIALLFAKGVGDNVRDSFVNDVVYELIKRGFFDKSIFDTCSILTSKGIQRRYFEASVRRKEILYEPEYMLIDVTEYANIRPVSESVPKKVQNVYILNENDNILKQSKVKERKVNSFSSEKNSDGGEADGKEEKTSTGRKRSYDHESSYYKAAIWLAEDIRKNNPGYVYPSEANLQTWADEARKLVELDKVEITMFKKVLNYARKDHFWQTNIMSMGTFRKKYNQLLSKYYSEESG